MQQLIEKGSVQRGWLGVMIQPVTKEISDSIGLKEAKGALVTDPLKGPAAKAGIKAGDVIISVNNEKINDSRDLAKRIANMSPEETVALEILGLVRRKRSKLNLLQCLKMKVRKKVQNI